MSHRAGKTDIAFALIWVAILIAGPCFKLSAKLTGWPDFQKRVVEENRILVGKPDFKATPTREWGRAIDAWYDDNFAWRSDTIRLYKSFRFNVAMCPIGQQVPGWHGMIFRREGTWPEIEDYLGAITLDEAMRRDWRTLMEGRVAWAEAHGAHYVEVIAPVKAQVHPELAPFTIRRMPGFSSRMQLAEEMKGSFAETNVIFFTDEFRAEARRGREMFYKEDHHASAYGCWMMYRAMVERLRDLWYPQLTITPYYDDPPEKVRKGLAFGAYTDPETRRLVVSSPGYTPGNSSELGISTHAPNYPQCPIFVSRPGKGLYLAMRHDSLLRFPLSSWRKNGRSDLAIPFGDGFSDIAMFIFKRFTTEELEKIVGPRVPDVIIEQIPECKISLGVFGLDETIRRAAEFARSNSPVDPDARRALALAVLDDATPEAEGGEMDIEIVDANGDVIGSGKVKKGVRRAVFLGAVEGAQPFAARLRGGTAKSIELKLRAAQD